VSLEPSRNPTSTQDFECSLGRWAEQAWCIGLLGSVKSMSSVVFI
jgi:hypothetical protein